MKRLSGAVVAVLVLLGACTMVCAGGPGQIHYQGRLVLADSAVNDTVDLVFRLFDAPVEGTLLFQENQSVNVVDGYYAVYIGAVSDLDAAVFRDHGVVYLEVEVNGQPMRPRDRIVSVGFAFSSVYAQEAAVAHRLVGDARAPTVINEGSGPAPLHVGSTTNVAFHVHMNSMAQSIPSYVDTKLDWQVKEFDTVPSFNLGSERFIAPVAGYYRLTAQVYLAPTNLIVLAKHDHQLAKIQLRHNGSVISSFVHRTSGKGGFSLVTTRDRYLGLNDYVEVYVRQNTSPNTHFQANGPISQSYFSGYLIQQ